MGTNIFGYLYDSIGNRKTTDHGQLTTTYLANELNQYTNILEGAASSAPEYDADGNMISYGAWTFEWDGENRLIVASNGATVVQPFYQTTLVKNGLPEANSFVGWYLIYKGDDNT